MTRTKSRKKALLFLSVMGAALLAFILLMYIINVYSSNYTGDQAIVDKKNREVFFWKDFPLTLMPSSASVREQPYALFQHHRLYRTYYYVTPINALILGDMGNAIIAVGEDQRAHILPDEYNEMIRDENIRVDSEAQALRAAGVYINSTCVYGTGMIVYNVSDIPGLSPADRAHPENISEDYPYDRSFWYNESNRQYGLVASVVRPPAVSRDDGAYAAEFSTWKSLRGVVESWKVRIDKDGAITVTERKGLEQDIGHCFGLAC